jgi:hypothetical protein
MTGLSSRIAALERAAGGPEAPVTDGSTSARTVGPNPAGG